MDFDGRIILELLQFIVLLVGVGVAIWAIRATRKLERQKAFLAFLREYIPDLRAENALDITRSKKNPGELDKGELTAMKHLLNKFEMLAIGLANDIYDRRMIEDSFGFSLTKTYERTKPYIDHIRRDDGDSKSYIEFQKLAESMIKNMSIPKRAKRS